MSEIDQDAQTAESSPAPETTEVVETEEVSAAEKPKNRAQERINQLTREKYEQRGRVEELERRLAEMEAKTDVKAEDTAAPEEVDFQTDAEYRRAQAEFVANQAAERAYAKLQQDRQQTDAAAQAKARQEQMLTKKAAFEADVEAKRAHFEDFDEVAYGHQFMDLEMADLIFELEKGPEVAYHLGSNQDEAARIYALPPVQRARELTKLEFQVSSVKPKTVSDAPDPIRPLGNRESVEVDESKMTADEWRAWRNKQVHG